MSLNDEPDIMKQEPRKVEVGYWKNRSKKFNGEVEKGLNGVFKTARSAEPSPRPAKNKSKKQETSDAKNKGSQSDEQ